MRRGRCRKRSLFQIRHFFGSSADLLNTCKIKKHFYTITPLYSSEQDPTPQSATTSYPSFPSLHTLADYSFQPLTPLFGFEASIHPTLLSKHRGQVRTVISCDAHRCRWLHSEIAPYPDDMHYGKRSYPGSPGSTAPCQYRPSLKEHKIGRQSRNVGP